MRWVFYTLLMVNVAYLPYGVMKALPLWMQPAAAQAAEKTDKVDSSKEALRQLKVVPFVAKSTSPQQGERLKQSKLCALVGPWTKQSEAQEYLSKLGQQGASASVRQLNATEQELSWVYLPPFATEEDALSALRQLQRLGVDSFITRDGDQENAISLGYFKNRDSARGVQQRIEREGYQAKIRQMDREVTEYWLQIALSATAQAEKVAASQKGLVVRQAQCE